MITPEAVPPSPASAPAPAPAPKSKMKGWKKGLLITGGVFLGLILVVLIVGPSIIAAVVKSKIPAVLAEQLQATATVGDVSVSWSGHVVLSDFRLVPKNFSDPLLEVKKIDVKVDVGAAIGGRYIAVVDVVAPKVIVEKGADGKFNYEFPPSPPAAPAEPKKAVDGKQPFVQATLKIRDGDVHIRGKGRDTVYQNLTVNAAVDTLEKPIQYDLSLESPMKDTLKVKGALDLATISGPAMLTLDKLSLKNLTGAARAYSDVLELDGTVSGSFNYELKGAPRFIGKGGLEIAGFSATMQGQTFKLDRLTLTHDGGIDDKGSGRHVITLGCGKAVHGTVTVDVVDAFGARMVNTDVKVDADLAALADVLDKVGALPKGMTLAGAVSLRGTCESKGPTQADLDAKKLRVAAKVDVDVTGSNLDIVSDGKPMKLDGFKLHHAGTLDENGNGKNTLTLALGQAVTAVAQVDVTDVMGKTPLVKADLKADSDLGELGKLLEKLIGLKQDMTLEGAAAIKGRIEAKGGESVKADIALSATNLVAIDGKDKKRHEIDKAIALKLVGGWEQKTQLAAADVITLTSSFATVDGKGGVILSGKRPELQDTRISFEANLGALAGKLKSFMEKPPMLGGTLKGQVMGLGESMGAKIDLNGLRCEQYGPFNGSLTQKGKVDPTGKGRLDLGLAFGAALDCNVHVDFDKVFDDDRRSSSLAIVKSDLAALSAMLPDIVQLKPGTSLAGALGVTLKAETKGSTWAKFEVSADVDDLSAVEKGKSQEIDRAIRFKTQGLWDGARRSVELATFTLSSAFATADAKGGFTLGEPMTVRESSLQLQADLEKLGAKLGLFMADAPGLAGSVTATGGYAGDQYTLDAAAKGVKIIHKGKTIGPIDATVVQKGTLSMAKDGAFKIETATVTSSAADLKLSGEIRKVMDDAREGEIKLEAVARPVELSKWMPDLHMGGPEIKLTTSVSLKPKLITVAGQTKLDGLTMTADGVTKTAKTGALDFIVTMKDQDILATLKTPSFEWIDKGYAAKGGLEAEGTYNDKGTTGTTKLANLEITDDKKNVVKDPGLTIVHDIGLADNHKTVDLRKVEVTSTFLRGSVTGKLLHLDTAPEFQKLHAAFRYIPDKVTAVAKPWLPGKLEGAEEKVLDFTLDGKAASMDVLALLRGTQGAIDVDLATFTMSDNGLSVSGKTHLDLKEGRLTSGTPLVVNKGKTELTASLDFNPAEKKPQSTIVFAAKDVDANGQMAPILERINPIFHTSGVDAKVDGILQSDFKMAWAGPIDPDEKDWVAAASKSLSGTGVFGAQNLHIAGSPAVGQIMAALGQGNALQGELVATQIRIGNGRCEYENMTLRGSRKTPELLQRDQAALAKEKQDLEAEKAQMTSKEIQSRQAELRLKEEDLPYRYVLRFSGYVRFDKRMELRVLMPMSDSMIKAHPNLQKYMGTSFWVDLKGTTDSPSLDTKKMLAELAQRAAEGILKDKVEDALKGLFNRGKEKDADKLFNTAQQSEAAKNNPQALQQYQKLLNDYGETDFVKKRKVAIQDRVKALGGK